MTKNDTRNGVVALSGEKRKGTRRRQKRGNQGWHQELGRATRSLVSWMRTSNGSQLCNTLWPGLKRKSVS